jgi:ribonuclease HI
MQAECMVDPGGRGATNTINRAELAGIWAALQRGHLTIATDSASSMAQIRRALLRPGSLGMHKHAELLEEVIQLVRNAAGPITLVKVKAHNGIIGNEMADAVARRAAAAQKSRATAKCDATASDATATTPIEHKFDLRMPTSATPSFTRSYWLYHPQQKNKPPRAMDGLRDPLRDHMHKHHRLGHSNQDSVYFQMWQKVAPDADGPLSNAYKQPHTPLCRGDRVMANKYRMGQLWNRKTAHRWGRAPDPMCPLCGALDGGHHMVSDCRDGRIQGMVAERHNDLGRTILRAISKGSRGGDIAVADVGNADKLAAAGCPAFPHNHVPERILPTLERAKLCKLKPDILIHNAHSNQMLIVELKTCRDTAPRDQLDNATTQHTELIRLLGEQHPGLYVKVIPLLVGVSGTIYRTHTLDALQALGLTRAKARSCAGKLHVKAVQWLGSIIRTRRMLEHQGRKPP